ncbi:vitamin D3 hydroxylase-associated protein-like [Ptychodera flava]|uniref:vitamin D3 hydroxylase-associated protein-like n=1 Tax=Ptychodera flava TaxID=63121 RepID=UPI003969E9AF
MTLEDCRSYIVYFTDPRKLFASFVAAYGIWWLAKKVQSRNRLLTLRKLNSEKKQSVDRRKARMKEELQTTDEDVLKRRKDIVDIPLTKLVDEIKSGVFSVQEVLQAFQAKALEATEEVNCVTEMIEEAKDIAQLLDSQDESHGLLHGIPFSIKDNINVKGYDSSLGLTKFINSPLDEDSVIVKILRLQGAIPFAKTNIPQIVGSFACSNPIYGETIHPTDRTRCPGGSSGGEGALICCNASPLGIGTDIGGSVRVPAHFCGICGLKPTKHRISTKGVRVGRPGIKGVSSTPGPMARDVDSLVLFMRALLVPEMFELDSSVPPLVFNDQVYNSHKRLRIGYCCDSKLFPPVPSCRRAVLLTKQLLEESGHILVPFQFPEEDGAKSPLLHLLRVLTAVKRPKKSLMEGEIVDGFRQIQSKTTKRSRLQRILMRPFQSQRERILSDLYNTGLEGIEELNCLYATIENYNQLFMAHWKKEDLDLLITPVAVSTAVSSIMAAKFHSMLQGWSAIFNVLDYPTGTLPITKVTEEDDRELENSYPENDMWYKLVKEASKNSAGLPVGVQCVALPWQEEMCLRIMKEIEILVNQRNQQQGQ